MRKYISIILISIGTLLPYSIFAQAEPRPEWVRQLPNAPSYANYVYVYGWGVGVIEKDAESEAFKNALFYAFNEGGLIGFEEQAKSLDDVLKMKNIDMKILKSIIPNRRVCQTLPICVSKNEVKVYVLLKVQKDKSKDIDFGNSSIECETEEFREAVEKYNQRFRPEAKEKTWNDFMLLYKEFSNQFFFNIGDGISYGLLGASFGGRHGGIVGFGYQFGLGVGYDYKLHYSGGVKFYPYNCLFLSANFGTVGIGKPQETYNNIDGSFTSKKDNNTQYGSSFLVGADICFGKNKITSAGGVINLAIGYSPDTKDVLKSLSFAKSIVWNVGIGIAF
jgi:hypothetical protein